MLALPIDVTASIRDLRPGSGRRAAVMVFPELLTITQSRP
jgi:hypothetical protein